MATPAVIRSRDCLRRNPHYNHTPKPFNRSRCNPEFNTRRNENKNRNPVNNTITVPKLPNKMVMGEVKILKRGDPLPEEKKIESKPHPVKKTVVKKPKSGKRNDSSDSILGSASRFGPEPEMVQKQIKVGDFSVAPRIPSCHFYAGSAPSVASPHPSSLPLPIALTKKDNKNRSFIADQMKLNFT